MFICAGAPCALDTHRERPERSCRKVVEGDTRNAREAPQGWIPTRTKAEPMKG